MKKYRVGLITTGLDGLSSYWIVTAKSKEQATRLAIKQAKEQYPSRKCYYMGTTKEVPNTWELSFCDIIEKGITTTEASIEQETPDWL